MSASNLCCKAASKSAFSGSTGFCQGSTWFLQNLAELCRTSQTMRSRVRESGPTPRSRRKRARLLDASANGNNDGSVYGVHAQLVEVTHVVINAMLIGERAQIDLHAILLDMNPSRKREELQDSARQRHDARRFHSEDHNGKVWKLRLPIDDQMELKSRE